MRILHVSDVHGDFDALRSLKDVPADVVVCSGDFIGPCLEKKQMDPMINAFNLVINNICTREQMSLRDFFLKVAGEKNLPEGLGNVRDAAIDYLAIEQSFDRAAEAQYKNLASVFSQFKTPILTVPGNWDSTIYFDHLTSYDLHRRDRQVDGVRFAGYGSTDVSVKLVPPTRDIPYSEDEALEHLANNGADVIVTHMPPRGVLDSFGESANQRNGGSIANLAAMLRATPDLWLCGHIHNARGVCEDKQSGTVVSNPGNLGQYFDFNGRGSFIVLERDKEGFCSNVEKYQIKSDGKISLSSKETLGA